MLTNTAFPTWYLQISHCAFSPFCKIQWNRELKRISCVALVTVQNSGRGTAEKVSHTMEQSHTHSSPKPQSHNYQSANRWWAVAHETIPPSMRSSYERIHESILHIHIFALCILTDSGPNPSACKAPSTPMSLLWLQWKGSNLQE